MVKLAEQNVMRLCPRLECLIDDQDALLHEARTQFGDTLDTMTSLKDRMCKGTDDFLSPKESCDHGQTQVLRLVCVRLNVIALTYTSLHRTAKLVRKGPRSTVTIAELVYMVERDYAGVTEKW